MDKTLQQALDGEVTLYRTSFPTGHEYVYRALTLKEYRIFKALQVAGQYQEYDLYSAVFERCCPGMTTNNAPAGLEISVGRFIMWISGDCATLDQIKQDIELVRHNAGHGSLLEGMKQWICIAQPAYTVHQMDGWNRERLLNEFICSEEILMKKHPGYKPLDVKSIRMASDDQPASNIPIDFKKENNALATGMGPWAMEEAREIEREQRAAQTRKLSPEEAKLLSKKRRG